MTKDDLIKHFEARIEELEKLLPYNINHKKHHQQISRLLELNKWFSYELDQDRFIARIKDRVPKPLLID